MDSSVFNIVGPEMIPLSLTHSDHVLKSFKTWGEIRIFVVGALVLTSSTLNLQTKIHYFDLSAHAAADFSKSCFLASGVGLCKYSSYTS